LRKKFGIFVSLLVNLHYLKISGKMDWIAKYPPVERHRAVFIRREAGRRRSAGRKGTTPNGPLTKTNSERELTMANDDNKAVKGSSVRILTVSSQRRPWARPKGYPTTWSEPPDYPDAPWIRLSGRWLEEAGFEISSKIRVEVEKGKLVITPA
jgi:toxic protein SymE